MGCFRAWKARVLQNPRKRRHTKANHSKRQAHTDHTSVTPEPVHLAPINTEPVTPVPTTPGETLKAQPQPIDPSTPQDLWQCAFEQLDQKDQDVLRSGHQSVSKERDEIDFRPKNIVEQVIESTENMYHEYQQEGGIKVKNPMGEDVELRKVAEKILNAAISVQNVINKGVACDPTGHAASAWALVSLGLTMTRNHQDRRNALFDSAEYLVEVLALCTYCEVNFFQPQYSDNKKMRSGLIRVYKAILQYTANVEMARKQHAGDKLLDSITAITSQRLEQGQSSIEKEEQKLYQSIQLDSFKKNEAAAEKILTAIDDKVLKSINELRLDFRLPIAQGAILGFYENDRDNMSKCLEETRVDVLSKILDWAESPDSKFFWLNGMAGTGKSTIALTVAKSFQEKGQLGATFFFKKDEAERGNAKRFMATIAKQLMGRNHQLASKIFDAIEKDSDIAAKVIPEQFAKLLLQPLQNLTQVRTRVIVIVVDALDECTENDLEIIFKLLPELQKVENMQLKIFMTSRPERQISNGIEEIRSHKNLQDLQELALHQVEKSVVEHDIRLFLESRLEEIRRNTPSLRSTNWPTDAELGDLVKKSVPLFIYAATACRFIGDGFQSPQKRLNTVLNSQVGPPGHQIQSMYQAVLEQLLNPNNQTESTRLEEEFRDTVGVIVLLAAPLSVHALAGLLPLTIPAEDIRRLVDKLRSVLSVPEDDYAPVFVLHESFREFVLHTDSGFYVDEENMHATIASHCLRVMEQHLKRNICNLQSYGIQHTDIDSQKIEQFLQPELQYSCRYWVYHLERNRAFDTKENILEENILRFLQQYFLHWVEAMSLMGMTSETVEMIGKLQLLEQVSSHRSNKRSRRILTTQNTVNSKLSQFLFDAKRFLHRNLHMTEIAPLQLYSSGLIFSPTESIVRKHFEEKRLEKLQALPQVKESWDADLQTLEGHSGWVRSVAFSPDSQTVASGSDDNTIKLWDAKTGKELQTLEGHSGWVQSVAFSPDSQTVASGSGDKTIKLWDAKTGKELQTLEGHSGWVQSVAFSPDSQTVASGSRDQTIKLWDAKTGKELQTLEGHSDWVQSVAFSPDSQTVASGSDDNTIKLWGAKTGKELQTLEGHSGSVQSVAFSPDSQTVASGSRDQTIKLWDAKTGKELQTLEGHSDWVQSVAFSPDSQTVASGSGDKTIKLWDAKTGKELQTLEGHFGPVQSVAFSPDSQTVASGSDDNTIKLWDAKTGKELQTLKGHSGWVQSIAFSPDSQTVASGSRDQTIKLWDTKTGKELQTLEGHSDWVQSVAFSPDSQTVASGSRDQTIKLWDAKTGKELQTLEGHSNSVASVVGQNSYKPNPQVSIANDWIVFRNKNLIWLPAEYRTFYCSAIQDGTLALGYTNGRVFIIGFRTD
ncbi:hypothetical protein N7490_003554 [Penicillium lividum]|nr:hypothetical protein N7490_003554 [Penicillium lividum]